MEKHWTNGGSGITNFDIEDAWMYKRAIQAYDGGRCLEIRGGMCPLHNDAKHLGLYLKGTALRPLFNDNLAPDLSNFWKIFNAIKVNSIPPIDAKHPPQGFRLITKNERLNYKMPSPSEVPVMCCHAKSSTWLSCSTSYQWNSKVFMEYNYAVPTDYNFTITISTIDAENKLSYIMGKKVKIR